MKRVLVVYYSQTGQLTRIVKSFMEPVDADDSIGVVYESVRPVPDYPFPWPFFKFFDTFPETVAPEPPQLADFDFDENTQFDLIVLAYTVWFLSPSLPIMAFLQSPQGRKVLAGTPVITVIGCRNMWLMAQDKVKAMLAQASAKLVANVVFVDQGNSFATFITTPYWMLTGKKRPFFGLLPPAGVSEKDIRGASRFGRAILKAFEEEKLDGSAPVLQGLKAVEADIRLLTSERVATRSFRIWGKLIRSIGESGSFRRVPVLLVYIIFLVTLILTVVPISMSLRTLFRPLQRKRHAQLKAYFEQPSGSDNFRMKEFQNA